MVNLPVLFTSLVAISAKLSSAFLQAAGLSSVASAMAAPAFIAAFIVLGAMVPHKNFGAPQPELKL